MNGATPDWEPLPLGLERLASGPQRLGIESMGWQRRDVMERWTDILIQYDAGIIEYMAGGCKQGKVRSGLPTCPSCAHFIGKPCAEIDFDTFMLSKCAILQKLQSFKTIPKTHLGWLFCTGWVYFSDSSCFF